MSARPLADEGVHASRPRERTEEPQGGVRHEARRRQLQAARDVRLHAPSGRGEEIDIGVKRAQDTGESNSGSLDRALVLRDEERVLPAVVAMKRVRLEEGREVPFARDDVLQSSDAPSSLPSRVIEVRGVERKCIGQLA